MSMAIIAAGVGVVSTGYTLYSSAKKDAAAKKLAKDNVRPNYKAGPEAGDVYNTSLAEVDNPQLQDYATNQLEQNQSSGIDAILKSGGKADFGVINNTYGTQLRSALATIQKNRDSKIAASNNAAYNLSASKDAEFQYNKDAPYKDAKQQEAILRQQSEQLKADAISSAASTVSNYAIATNKPGQYGNNGSLTESNRISNGNPDLITSTSLVPTGGNATNGNQISNSIGTPGIINAANNTVVQNQPPSVDTYTDGQGRMITGYDHWGNPIYAH